MPCRPNLNSIDASDPAKLAAGLPAALACATFNAKNALSVTTGMAAIAVTTAWLGRAWVLKRRLCNFCNCLCGDRVVKIQQRRALPHKGIIIASWLASRIAGSKDAARAKIVAVTARLGGL